MTSTHCPSCYHEIQAKPGAREGRHPGCRPEPKRRHSRPRPVNDGLAALVAEHNRNYTQ